MAGMTPGGPQPGSTRSGPPQPPAPGSRRRRRALLGALVLALAAAIALVAVLASGSAAPSRRRVAAPPLQSFRGSFYAVAGRIPRRPGVLLRYQTFTTGVPSGGKAWRILYTTTRADGSVALASAVVLVPTGTGSAPSPVIAWAHGTTGVAQTCAPSLIGGNEPFYAGFPAVGQVVKQGWAIVAPDYPGLGTSGPAPYLIGAGEAHSVLDAVRAARRLPEASLSGRTVVWGYSQGGQAAIWTGALAPSYAPDVKLSGVAAMAPANDPGLLLDLAARNATAEALEAYTVTAFAAAYRDVHLGQYVLPQAEATVRAAASRCLEGPETAVQYLESLPSAPWPFVRPLMSGALGRRLAQNIPTRRVAAPLLVAQGLADETVRPDVQQQWVAGRCASGQSLEYRTYPGRTHSSLDEEGSALIPDLLGWTAQRLAGQPAPRGCTSAVG